MSKPSESTAQLNLLVEQCAADWEGGGASTLEALCAQHPEHAENLRRRVVILQRAGLLPETAAAGGPAPAPRRLGDFRLEGELGSGGMGIVHVATQESLGRRVALKIIRPEQAFSETARQRFLREAGAVARLQHPGIVPVHVVGEEGGVLFYAMDLVEGCSLAQALQHLQGREPGSLTGADLRAAVVACTPGQPRPTEGVELFGRTWVETCLRLAQRVAEALEHAHGRGVLHRDVKPSNVMLTPDGRVLLLDFGLASADGDPRITRSGAQVGSLAYMAPEQVRGDHASIGRATDVYAVGLLLYEALSLSQPFVNASSERTRQAVLEGQPPPLRARNRALSPDVELVCRCAMDQDPARRYARAIELARDLANVLALRPITARAPSRWLRTTRAARRHPARAVTLGFVALLTLVVFPGLFLQQRAARLALLEEKGRTDAALVAAQEARARAEAQAGRARWGLGKAREAVDRFLANIGQFRAVDVPLLEELRSATLREALELYEQLLAGAESESPELARDRDRTRFSLTQVLRELGRSAEAEPILVQLLADLGAEAPDDSRERRLFRAQAWNALGSTRWAQARSDAAVEPLLTAQASLRALGAVPAAADVAALLLRNTVLLAQVRLAQEQIDEAGALFREAVAVAPQEERLDILPIRADAHDGLARIAGRRSEIQPAIDESGKAIELRRASVARAPTSARFRKDLAAALENLGLHLHRWRPPELPAALAYLEEAGALRNALAREFPQHPGLRVDVCRSRIIVAQLRTELGQPGDAERDMRAAIAGLEDLRKELPTERAWRQPLGYARYTLTNLLQGQQRTAEAAQESALAVDLARTLAAGSRADEFAAQGLAEILCVRSGSGHVPALEALALAREAFALGLTFLTEHPDNAHLRGTAYRCFANLAELLCQAGEPMPVVAVADAYRDANPYKWQSQLTLARTYLRARDMATADEALRQRCYDAARGALLAAVTDSAKAIERIAADQTLAPVVTEEELRAHAAGVHR